MLTAQQIHEKNFAKGFKGYDMDDVDAFLDEVIESFDKLSRENHELAARIEALNTQIESYRGMENTMMHTMVTVHKAAEEITESAKREADEVYSKARIQADEMVERAQQESDQVLQKAREDSERILENYRNDIQATEDELLSLRNLLEEFKTGIRHYSDELLSLVDTMNAPKEVDEVAARVEVEEEEEPTRDYVGQYVSAINGRGYEDSDFGPADADEEDDDLA